MNSNINNVAAVKHGEAKQAAVGTLLKHFETFSPMLLDVQRISGNFIPGTAT